MGTKLVKEWKVTISLTRELMWPVEYGEGEETFREWLFSEDGRKHIKDDFFKGMRLTGVFSKNTDLEIDEIELKETEVKSTDTDPRV